MVYNMRENVYEIVEYLRKILAKLSLSPRTFVESFTLESKTALYRSIDVVQRIVQCISDKLRDLVNAVENELKNIYLDSMNFLRSRLTRVELFKNLQKLLSELTENTRRIDASMESIVRDIHSREKSFYELVQEFRSKLGSLINNTKNIDSVLRSYSIGIEGVDGDSNAYIYGLFIEYRSKRVFTSIDRYLDIDSMKSIHRSIVDRYSKEKHIDGNLLKALRLKAKERFRGLERIYIEYFVLKPSLKFIPITKFINLFRKLRVSRK